MATPTIQEDCVGLVLKIPLLDGDGEIISLVDNTSILFIFTDPASTKTTKTGYVFGDEIDGIAGYTTVAGDLNLKGTWKYQAKITFSDGTIYFTEVKKIKVKVNL